MNVYDYSIVLQEVPDEISLALTISGCPYVCKDCHSEETWDSSKGVPLSFEYIDKLILQNKHISCILFMGGDWDIPKLYPIIEYIKNTYIELKIALYSGKNSINLLRYKPNRMSSNKDFLALLDYVKIGSYNSDLGGLSSKSTNQRFYKKNNDTWVDKTYVFHK